MQNNLLDALEQLEASSKTNRRSKKSTVDRSTKPRDADAPDVVGPEDLKKMGTIDASSEHRDSVASLNDSRDKMKPRKIEFGTL